MSDLQASLVVIGACVIGAVWLYNWLQERNLRRRTQESFAAHEDVLLRSAVEPALADGRLEPSFGSRSAGLGGHAGPALAATEPHEDDFELDYVAGIESEAPVPEAVMAELASRASACGKPVRLWGLEQGSDGWVEIARGHSGRYTSIRVALQLVSRSGAVNAATLAAFCDAVRAAAERVGASPACPDPQAALKRARDLDEFCAGVDVAIGLNVVAADGAAAFAGERIRSVAEATGLKLEPDGVFHYRDSQRRTVFTLDNHEAAPLLPESIKGLSTRGVTLLLDVPRVPEGEAALDAMVEVAHQLAVALGGEVVDDNRAALSASGIARIREQVRSIRVSMEARGIPAGSAKALRLFA